MPKVQDIFVCKCDLNSEIEPCSSSHSCLNRASNYECHPRRCLARDRCCNLQFQQHNYCQVQVFLTNNRGWGVKAQTTIEKGTFVSEYVGQILDSFEFNRRLNDRYFTNEYIMKLDSNYYIDSELMGNVTRFISMYILFHLLIDYKNLWLIFICRSFLWSKLRSSVVDCESWK